MQFSNSNHFVSDLCFSTVCVNKLSNFHIHKCGGFLFCSFALLSFVRSFSCWWFFYVGFFLPRWDTPHKQTSVKYSNGTRAPYNNRQHHQQHGEKLTEKTGIMNCWKWREHKENTNNKKKSARIAWQKYSPVIFCSLSLSLIYFSFICWRALIFHLFDCWLLCAHS